jgi:hypothetical protein
LSLFAAGCQPIQASWAWRFHAFTPGPRGALAEIDAETVRVLRTSAEPADGREMECAEGTLWIVETEAV